MCLKSCLKLPRGGGLDEDSTSTQAMVDADTNEGSIDDQTLGGKWQGSIVGELEYNVDPDETAPADNSEQFNIGDNIYDNAEKQIDEQILLESRQDGKPSRDRNLIGGSINDRLVIGRQGSDGVVHRDVTLEVVVPKATPNDTNRVFSMDTAALGQQEIKDTVDHFVRRFKLSSVGASTYTIPYNVRSGSVSTEENNTDIEHHLRFRLYDKNQRVIAEHVVDYIQNKLPLATEFDRGNIEYRGTTLSNGKISVGDWELYEDKKVNNREQEFRIQLSRSQSDPYDIIDPNEKSDLYLTLPKNYRLTSSGFELQEDGRYKKSNVSLTGYESGEIYFSVVSDYETKDIPDTMTFKVEYGGISKEFNFDQSWNMYYDGIGELTVESSNYRTGGARYLFGNGEISDAKLKSELVLKDERSNSKKGLLVHEVGMTRNQRSDGRYFNFGKLHLKSSNEDVLNNSDVYGLPESYQFKKGEPFRSTTLSPSYEDSLVHLGKYSELTESTLNGYQAVVVRFPKGSFFKDLTVSHEGSQPETWTY